MLTKALSETKRAFSAAPQGLTLAATHDYYTLIRVSECIFSHAESLHSRTRQTDTFKPADAHAQTHTQSRTDTKPTPWVRLFVSTLKRVFYLA